MAKYTYQMSFNEIDEGIKSVQNRTKSIIVDIHKMNVSVLVQWLNSKDVRQPVAYATKLVNELKDTYKAQAVADWFTAYAGFTWNKETKSFEYAETKITEDRVKAAKNESFDKFSPPKEVQPLDVLSKLETLINTASKRLTADEKKRSPKDQVSKEEVEFLMQAKREIAKLRG